MFLYIKTMYDQWCSGQELCDIITRSDHFIDLVHSRVGYNKEELKSFLYCQPWFQR